MIWNPNKGLTLEYLHTLSKGTMAEHLGIEFVKIGDDHLVARMPVDHRTKQPFGLLHGGASVALAETLGSVAAALVIDHTISFPVGLEINANHIRSATSGYVYGTARPFHTGNTTQVWEIKITDEEERLVCVSRITVAILKRKESDK